MYKMNPKYIGDILKNTDEVFVYLNPAYPGEICKKYNLVRTDRQSRKELSDRRKKSIDIKKDASWPDFVIKPTNIGRMNKECFTVRYPFIEGETITNYIKNNDISLEECAIFLKKLEERLASAENYVFTDIGNPNNIIIQNTSLDFTVIDPDNILFKDYKDAAISNIVAPSFEKEYAVYGLRKCRRYSKYTKQLELRSMYALLYYMINGYDRFYPYMFERKEIYEYMEILKKLNIPESSELYRKSMQTLYGNKPNESIGNSLFELIKEGYELETYDEDYNGYKHVLIKK